MPEDILRDARVGFAMTGSFCTFRRIFPVLEALVQTGAQVTPILSYAVSQWDTRFLTARETRQTVETLCGREAVVTIPQAEPIGPKKLLDLLIVAPCTGNTCAKLAMGVADTPVTLAVKSHLRNDRPVLVGISTNDGLAANAKSLGMLMGRKHFFFVPYGQDDCQGKPASLVLDEKQLVPAARAALEGVQLQPELILNK